METRAAQLFKHEIRTPINHIVGYSELILEAALDDEEEAVAKSANELVKDARLLAETVGSFFERQNNQGLHNSAELHRLLKPLIHRLLTSAQTEGLTVDPWRDDVERIRLAAHKLEALSANGLPLEH